MSENIVVYVIGDIHGCFFTLEKLLKKIRIKDEDPHFVFIGDYVDRGLHSKQVVELVVQLKSEGAMCLRGNHDDIVGWILNRECLTSLKETMSSEATLPNVGQWWLANGLFQTITSYMKVGTFTVETLQEFVDIVPKNHKIFFRDLKTYWENDTHFVVHAHFPSDKYLPRSMAFLSHDDLHGLLWDRFPVHVRGGVDCDHPVWNKIGVFGHTPVSTYGSVAPVKHGNLRLIDTGAFMDAYLTAYCVEQDCWQLQATDSRDIA